MKQYDRDVLQSCSVVSLPFLQASFASKLLHWRGRVGSMLEDVLVYHMLGFDSHVDELATRHPRMNMLIFHSCYQLLIQGPNHNYSQEAAGWAPATPSKKNMHPSKTATPSPRSSHHPAATGSSVPVRTPKRAKPHASVGLSLSDGFTPLGSSKQWCFCRKCW